MSEEELTKASGRAGHGRRGWGRDHLLPIMQSIMQNLLSKDVLYPSLKEITERFVSFCLCFSSLFLIVSIPMGYFVYLETVKTE